MVHSRSRGFTLIEVMVAFAIFALSLGAIFEVFAGATRRAERARESEELLLTAESVLAQLRTRAAPWPEHEEGPENGTPASIVWHLAVEPFEAGANPDFPWKAYLVSVRVGFASGHREVTLNSVELARVAP